MLKSESGFIDGRNLNSTQGFSHGLEGLGSLEGLALNIPNPLNLLNSFW